MNARLDGPSESPTVRARLDSLWAWLAAHRVWVGITIAACGVGSFIGLLAVSSVVLFGFGGKMPPPDPRLMVNFLVIFLMGFIPGSLAAGIALAPVVWGFRALLRWGRRDGRQSSN
jgi:hypothetical protein